MKTRNIHTTHTIFNLKPKNVRSAQHSGSRLLKDGDCEFDSYSEQNELFNFLSFALASSVALSSVSRHKFI